VTRGIQIHDVRAGFLLSVDPEENVDTASSVPNSKASRDSTTEPDMSDENQHWVPKFLVKNFADRDGRVFCLDIHTDQITKPPPRQAASEKGFNDFEVDGETISEQTFIKRRPVLATLVHLSDVASGVIRLFDR
jgi:Protein of unknown function (DUF4238)